MVQGFFLGFVGGPRDFFDHPRSMGVMLIIVTALSKVLKIFIFYWRSVEHFTFSSQPTCG